MEWAEKGMESKKSCGLLHNRKKDSERGGREGRKSWKEKRTRDRNREIEIDRLIDK